MQADGIFSVVYLNWLAILSTERRETFKAVPPCLWWSSRSACAAFSCVLGRVLAAAELRYSRIGSTPGFCRGWETWPPSAGCRSGGSFLGAAAALLKSAGWFTRRQSVGVQRAFMLSR